MDLNSESCKKTGALAFVASVSVDAMRGGSLNKVAERFWWSWQIRQAAPLLDLDEVPLVLSELTSAEADSLTIKSWAELRSD